MSFRATPEFDRLYRKKEEVCFPIMKEAHFIRDFGLWWKADRKTVKKQLSVFH
jgi:hypothetical protein